MSEIIKIKSIINGIAKKYNLTFCPIHKYYEGNAYNNDKGETLPNYFSYRGNVYELKYFSGCFNPFLVCVSHKIRLKANDAIKRMGEAKTPEAVERLDNYVKYLDNLFVQ